MAGKKKDRVPGEKPGQSKYALKVARRKKEARAAGEHDLPYPVLRSTEEAAPVVSLNEWNRERLAQEAGDDFS